MYTIIFFGVIFLFLILFLLFDYYFEKGLAEEKLTGKSEVTYFQLNIAENWSFFEPSFKMVEMRITKKKNFLGIFCYSYEKIREFGPVKNSRGRNECVRILRSIIQRETGLENIIYWH